MEKTEKKRGDIKKEGDEMKDEKEEMESETEEVKERLNERERERVKEKFGAFRKKDYPIVIRHNYYRVVIFISITL